MNFLKSLTLGAASLVIFSQCGGGVDFSKPESVAVAFSKAAASADFATAKKYADEGTGKLLDMVQGMSSSMPEDKKKEGKENAKLMKSAKCTVDGDKAKCTICCDKDGKDSPEAVDLAKKDGKWLVSIDKGAKENGPKGTPDSTPAPAGDSTTTPAVDTTKK